jgi:hypothetical protein
MAGMTDSTQLLARAIGVLLLAPAGVSGRFRSDGPSLCPTGH